MLKHLVMFKMSVEKLCASAQTKASAIYSLCLSQTICVCDRQSMYVTNTKEGGEANDGDAGLDDENEDGGLGRRPGKRLTGVLVTNTVSQEVGDNIDEDPNNSFV